MGSNAPFGPGLAGNAPLEIGHVAIKSGLVVLYRCIFDLARDFMNEETLGDESNKMLVRYLKPDRFITALSLTSSAS
jgi:hypothetical protein